MKTFFKILLLIFLSFEIVFSFLRFTNFPTDGDLPVIVLPDKSYSHVLKDPFGLDVLLHNAVYPATNRYFAHLSLSAYFNIAPVIFQYMVSPIESIYVSCAFIKTLIQFFIIYILSVYITNRKKVFDTDVLFAAALITPLFQTYGYSVWMGVIDHSISYTFFYALAICPILLFFLPFFNAALQRRSYSFNLKLIILLLFLTVFLSFNGPLNTAIILIICPTVLLYLFIKIAGQSKEVNFLKRILGSVKSLPHPLLIVFCFAILASLYSFYIGRNNSENLWETMPMKERYSRLWQGFYIYCTHKLGPPLLISMLIINYNIIKRSLKIPNSENIVKILKWFLFLALIYIFLLPLGGYRSYRPNIVRWDTILPVTLSLILFYGLTTFYIIKNISFKYKKLYYVVIIIFSYIFINADKAILVENTCEKNALEKLSISKEAVVLLDNDCSVLSWGKILDYRDSEVKAELLHRWGVMKEKKLFYQK